MNEKGCASCAHTLSRCFQREALLEVNFNLLQSSLSDGALEISRVRKCILCLRKKDDTENARKDGAPGGTPGTA